LRLYIDKTRLEFHPSLPFVFAFFAAAGYLGQLIALFVCVTLHEAAHILLGRIFGLRTERILFTPIGEAAGIKDLEYLPPKRRRAVLLAGPLANFFIAAIVYRLRISDGFALTNAIIGVFNLLPAPPLDGGRLLSFALDNRVGMAAGAAITRRTGVFTGFALILAGFVQIIAFPLNGSLLIAGLYILYYAKKNSDSGESWFYRASALKQARRRALPVKILRAGHDMPLRDALRRLTWDYYHIFVIERGSDIFEVGEGDLIGYAAKNGLTGSLWDLSLFPRGYCAGAKPEDLHDHNFPFV